MYSMIQFAEAYMNVDVSSLIVPLFHLQAIVCVGLHVLLDGNDSVFDMCLLGIVLCQFVRNMNKKQFFHCEKGCTWEGRNNMFISYLVLFIVGWRRGEHSIFVLHAILLITAL